MRNTFFATALVTAFVGSAFTSGCSGDIGKLPFDTGGSAGAGVGGGNVGGGAGGDPIENPQFAPAPGGIRKLLARQYINSVKLVLGDVAAANAAPPEDSTLNEFETLAAAELALPPTAVEAYETSARDIAGAVIFDPPSYAKIVPCTPVAADDAACHQQVIENVGHQLWRRALTPEEITPIVDIAKAAGVEYGNFIHGVEYSLMVLLQSPYFLYTVEIGLIDPEHPEWFKLTGPEMATRLSLFLTDSIPDKDLLTQAETGGLETEAQIRDTARALMKKPEARAALNSFYDVLFKLRDLPSATKDAAVFPEWNSTLGQSARMETLMFLEDLVWNQNGDYRDLYNANYTFVDATLATFYGVSPPGGAGFQKVTLPADQKRTGFFGHAGYLARYSHAAQTSPTRRGVFISNMLLCNEIPPPPPGVNTTLPVYDPNNPKTKKQTLEELHYANDQCKGCHLKMDPFAFPLEIYNGIGKYRTVDENGLTLDPTGEVADFGAFTNVTELGQLVHDDPRAMNCIVSNLFKQSMGHSETKGERPAIFAIQDAFEASGFKLQEAIVEIVASPAFSYVNLPK
ncbi:MAG: DUF1592 domain-containing protein [Polyangiaceae bacterium]|nr:DUF1592 domain-containing protein [Polyangiaceae bacterium]